MVGMAASSIRDARTKVQALAIFMDYEARHPYVEEPPSDTLVHTVYPST
jgi:hypothetical protein